MLARQTTAKATTPTPIPASGMNHWVGSSTCRESAATAPTTAATTDAPNTPSQFGQNAARDVRVRRAKLPRLGHHAKPPAMLSSTASTKLKCGSSLRPPSGANAASSPQVFCEKTMTMMPTRMISSSGASTRHTASTDTGPRARISAETVIAISASRLAAAPAWESSMPNT